MAADESVDALVGRVADERVLGEDPALLPAVLGRPRPLAANPARGRVVGAGLIMTTVTLLGGTVLALSGAIDLLFEGGGILGVVALIVGLLLAGTHWGWIHMAEAYGDSLERRGNAGVIDERQHWLRSIAPHVHYAVSTTAGADGSITIERIRHRPVPVGERGFMFRREVELSEAHSGDEPAAVVTERAELLRRQAALDTEREREHFETLADGVQRRELKAGDDRERRAVLAAESQALSEQINANLRDPPLIE